MSIAAVYHARNGLVQASTAGKSTKPQAVILAPAADDLIDECPDSEDILNSLFAIPTTVETTRNLTFWHGGLRLKTKFTRDRAVGGPVNAGCGTWCT